jgi:ComF family protein
MWKRIIRPSAEAFASLLYPPHCVLCAADTRRGEHLCEPCGRKARRIQRPFCNTCSEPFDGAIDGIFSCANCVGREFHFTHAIAGFRSRGVVREIVHLFKYHAAFYLRQQLADWLHASLDDHRMQAQPIDFLVPVPLHPARQREREFNQAEVLATLLSARSGLKVSTALRRVRYTTTQTRLDRHERMENLRNAFTLRQDEAVRGMHLVLVDDVLTTGSTLDECARILRKAGAASVRAITVARG